MTTTTIANGQSSNGADVTSGNTLDIQSGGSANVTTIENGGAEIVESGGSDNAATIKAGATQTVGGSSNSAMVSGTQTIASGGTGNAETILNGGMQTIASGGSDNAATIQVGGTQTVNGTATNAAVSGTQTVNSGGVDSNLVVNIGGVVTLLKGGVATNSTVNAGGTLAINGNAQANGVTLQGGTLDLQSAKADTGATGTLSFASGFNSTLSIDVAQPTVTTFSETISNFVAGDVIDEKGLTFAGATLSTSTTGTVTTVTVTGGNNTGSQAFSFSNAASTPFALANDGNGGTDIVVCFASGTRIRTASLQGSVSDVPVEALAVGDLVVTSGGEHRPVCWLGHRTVECVRHPRPNEVMPVRISAHAFGEGRPMRDLVVSPGHSIAVDLLGEVLIPAIALINGSTVVQERAERVTYWHVELASHDVILAEGLPAESYLDMGNRDFFTEGAAVTLHGAPDVSGASHADFCRPFHDEGRCVDFVRERLRARAQMLGWRQVEASLSDMHLVVDGRRMEPTLRGMTASILLPAGTKSVWLVSGAQRPIDLGLSPDARCLGLCVAEVAAQDGFGGGSAMHADDARLIEGFHAVEPGSARWTSGRARLPEVLWEGCEGAFFLRIDFARMPLPRWQLAAAEPVSAQEAA